MPSISVVPLGKAHPTPSTQQLGQRHATSKLLRTRPQPQRRVRGHLVKASRLQHSGLGESLRRKHVDLKNIDPHTFQSWQVKLNNVAQDFLGTVEEVVPSPDAIGQHLLRVVSPVDPHGAHGIPCDADWVTLREQGLRETHLIPLVPAIVVQLDAANQTLLIDPPQGLLELGRQRVLLQYIHTALEPFLMEPPAKQAREAGIKRMPTKTQLVRAGQHRLLAAIDDCGGILQVALQLGLQCTRKPTGYWDNLDNLDQELTLFVAANWVRFSDPDVPDHYYWYNQISGRVSHFEPVVPTKVPLFDDGSYVWAEDEEDRVLPSRSQLAAAGRFDLINAIKVHGGHRDVAEALDRAPARPRTPHPHLPLDTLTDQLMEFKQQHGLPEGLMPSSGKLRRNHRTDLYAICDHMHEAVYQHGGFRAVAAQLGWGMSRRKNGTAQGLTQLVPDFIEFAQQQQLRRQQHSMATVQPASSAPSQSLNAAFTGQEPATSQALPDAAAVGKADGELWASDTSSTCSSGNAGTILSAHLVDQLQLPTRRELQAAGRHDLVYALTLHGNQAVAAATGLALGKYQRRKRRERKSRQRQQTNSVVSPWLEDGVQLQPFAADVFDTADTGTGLQA